jgi:hypothetical protein
MTELLFATPWWLVITLVIVGGVVFRAGNNARQKGAKIVGLVLIGIAILLKTISFFVETDKEKVTRQTSALVTAVQQRDWTTFNSLLEDDVSLKTNLGTVFPNRDALVKGAREDTETYNLTSVSARVTSVAADDADTITVDINASSQQAATLGYPVPSSWKLIWEKTGKDWRLHEVTCLSIGNEKSADIGRYLGR